MVTIILGWRTVLMQYSGVLAIGTMSLAMLLAVRPVVFEPYLGGLDKMYRLHKWLGISALVLAVSHWLLSEVPKWLTELGWLTRTVREPRSPLPDDLVRQFLNGQRSGAESIGELAFYAAVALIVLALVKRFPYRYFFKTHQFIAVAYRVLVWHSLVLLQWDYWRGLLGLVMGLLMLAGSGVSLLVLFGRVAGRRQLVGEVSAIRRHDALQVMEVDITFQGRWPGHQAGQFVFVTLHANEGAHPYTISSAWTNDGRLTFIIKALGDYTSTLATRLKVNDIVKVEGPYGRFNFEGPQPRQIWVGAGIGTTPFIARMHALAKAPDGKNIHLFHTTRVLDAHAVGLIERDAKAAHISLTVYADAWDGLLSAARIAELEPGWRDADIWFCGPTPFGKSLQKDFAAKGLAPGRFHQKLFELR
jgi:predicted ferric reductase